jgi:hypothetical protein
MPSPHQLPKYSRAAVWMRIARKRKLLDRVDCWFTLAGAKRLQVESAEAISEAGCEVRTNCKDRRLRCPSFIVSHPLGFERKEWIIYKDVPPEKLIAASLLKAGKHRARKDY